MLFGFHSSFTFLGISRKLHLDDAVEQRTPLRSFRFNEAETLLFLGLWLDGIIHAKSFIRVKSSREGLLDGLRLRF